MKKHFSRKFLEEYRKRWSAEYCTAEALVEAFFKNPSHSLSYQDLHLAGFVKRGQGDEANILREEILQALWRMNEKLKVFFAGKGRVYTIEKVGGDRFRLKCRRAS